MALLNRLSRALQGAARSSTALLPRRTRTAAAAVVAFAPRPQARALLEEFEPRVLYSADTPLALLGDAVVRLAADPAPAAAPAADTGSAAAQSTAAASTAAHEIAFVDTQVADYERLVADLQRQADAGRPIEVHLLDAGQDGIRQITDTLQGRQDLTAVHIFSHGIDGAVELGGAWLNAYSLEARADAIGQWRAALAPGADLLLYGCDVAADADGQAFIGRLAELTGADVAASRDATGSAALGGNWNLEYATGAIETGVAIDAAGQAQYGGLFAIVAGNTSSAPAAGGNSLTFSHTVGSGSNGLLIVSVSYQGGSTTTVTSITYGGTALTRLGFAQNSSGANVTNEMWSLKAPGAGTASIVVSTSASVSSNVGFTAGASNFFGVDQATPTGAYVGAAANSRTPSVTVASAAGELVIDSLAERATTTGTANAGQVEKYHEATGIGSGSDMFGASSTQAGASSVTMGWSTSGGGNGEYAMSAVSIKAATNSAPTGAPQIGSSATEGQTLTADTSSIADADGLGPFAYQWLRSGTAIAGATASTYVPGNADVGATMSVQVSYTDGHGTAESLTSAPTTAVANVNDAPVLANGSTLAYTENQTATAINTVLTVADVDSATLAGATVSIGTGFNAAQDALGFTAQGGITGSYNATTGVLSLTGSASAAAYQTALRSVTYSNSSDDPSTAGRTVSFQVNDGSPSSNLSNATTSTVSVTAVNDAPVLANSSTLAYTENQTATAINTVLTVADVDSATLAGATVSIGTGFNAAQDALGFTAQGGITGSYNATTGVLSLTGSASAAAYQTALRSVTYSNSSDDPSTASRTVSFQVNDGSPSGNLSNVTTSTVSVTAVNDAPVLANSSTLAYTENQTATAINTVLTVADVDSATLAGATVSIGTGFNAAQDALGFTAQGGITGSYNATTGVLSLTGSASAAAYQTALRSVTYSNSSDDPSTASRTVGFQVDDGSPSGNLSNVITSTVSVAAVNDAPVLANGSTLAYTENQTATAINTVLTVADVDSATLAGATVSIGTGFNAAQDALGFTAQGGITGSYNATTGVLSLTGSASAAAYQTALRSVTYSNSSDDPSTASRTVGFQVDDGSPSGNLSNVITSTVSVTAVNDAPVLANGSTLAYTENQTATAINTVLTVADVDSATLAGATVSIGTGFNAAQDALGFTAQGGITGSYNATTGVLSLTGSASAAAYQTALRSVTYSNSSDDPSTASRTVSFQVNDGSPSGNLSNVTTSTVSVTAVNDAPVLANGSTLAYTENQTATAINTVLTVADVDSATLAGATVSIGTGFNAAQDALGFTTQGGIAGSYNTTTGVLTLTGSTSAAAYQTALRSVTYSNSSDDPSTAGRTVSFQVNDGSPSSNLSNATTSTVSVTAVNDAPVLANSSTLAYTENQTATAINTVLTVADVDSATLAGATVSIGTGFNAAQDALGFTAQGGITGSYNATTGVLSLTGSASAAAYQTALRSVTYSNSSDDPSTASRTVSFQVNDGSPSGNLSNVTTSTVSVTAVNDAPVLANGSTLAYTENQTATAINTVLTVADVDSATLAGATVSIGTGFNAAQDALGFTTQGGIAGSYNTTTGVLTLTGSTSAAAYQTALRSVTYSNSSDDPSTASRTVSFQVDDGSPSGNLSNAITSTVSVAAVNDAPTGSVTISGTATQGETLTASNTLADADGIAAGAISYQWQANGTDIGGATRATLVLGEAQVGKTVTVVASYTDGHGTAETRASSPTAAVDNVNDAPTGAPAVTGTATERQTLSADVSSIADADGLGTFAYQWLRDGQAVAGATANIYLLGNADVDAKMSVQVSYTDAHGTPESLTSAPTSPVVNVDDAPTGIPATVGTAAKYRPLAVDTSAIADADGLGAFAYQWYRDGRAVAGATAATYVPGNADLDARISVQVSYTDGHGTVESLVSAPTAPVAFVDAVPVVAANRPLTLDEGGIARIDVSLLQATDDDDAPDQLTYTVDAPPSAGRLESTAAPGFVLTRFTQADVDAGRLRYVHDGSETSADRFGFVLADGHGAVLASVTFGIAVTAQNDAPVLGSASGASLVVASGAAAQPVDRTFAVSDVDSPLLTQAVVRIDSRYLQGFDQLSLAGTHPLTAVWNAADGSLTLSGSASPAAYAEALRSVQFATSSPLSGGRQLSFVVSDGAAASAPVTKSVVVLGVALPAGVGLAMPSATGLLPQTAATATSGGTSAAASTSPAATVGTLPARTALSPASEDSDAAGAEETEASSRNRAARLALATLGQRSSGHGRAGDAGGVDAPGAGRSALERFQFDLVAYRLAPDAGDAEPTDDGVRPDLRQEPKYGDAARGQGVESRNAYTAKARAADLSELIGERSTPDTQNDSDLVFDVLAEPGVSGGLIISASVLWWATRAGGLLAAMMASVPAWRSFDPLPILARAQPGRRTDTVAAGVDDGDFASDDGGDAATAAARPVVPAVPAEMPSVFRSPGDRSHGAPGG